MAQQQVITVQENGVMSGLQVKPGKGLDLTKFGKAKVTRASEIVWDEDYQAWKVDVLQEKGRGVLTNHRFYQAFVGDVPGDYREAAVKRTNARLEELGAVTGSLRRAVDGPYVYNEADLLFPTYDKAVQAEIDYLNQLRLIGQY